MIVEARNARGHTVLLDALTLTVKRGTAVVGDHEINALASLPERTAARWIAARVATWNAARGGAR